MSIFKRTETATETEYDVFSGEAANDYDVIPAGEYTANTLKVERFKSKNNTAGYKITYKIVEGEHKDRRLWSDHWRTPTAAPYTKRDMAKLGIFSDNDIEKAEQYRVSLNVVVRMRDDGIEYNEVKSFRVLGRVEIPAEVMAFQVEPIEPKPIEPKPVEPTDKAYSDEEWAIALDEALLLRKAAE